jgi:hypothetical protein
MQSAGLTTDCPYSQGVDRQLNEDVPAHAERCFLKGILDPCSNTGLERPAFAVLLDHRLARVALRRFRQKPQLGMSTPNGLN